jgi:hypothetical protein
MTNRQAKQKLRQIQHKQRGLWHQAQNQPAHVKNQAPQTETVKIAKQTQQTNSQKNQKPSKHDIIMLYGYQDLINKDKVYTPEAEKIILSKISEVLGPEYAFADSDHFYGEVLNRFGV